MSGHEWNLAAPLKRGIVAVLACLALAPCGQASSHPTPGPAVAPEGAQARQIPDALDVAAFQAAMACGDRDQACRQAACARIGVDWIATRCRIVSVDAPGASAQIARGIAQYRREMGTAWQQQAFESMQALKGRARDQAMLEFLARRAATALISVGVAERMDRERAQKGGSSSNAQSTDAAAYAELGKVYYDDLPQTPANSATALSLLRKAAAQGDPEGQLGLGLAYQEGRAVTRDLSVAAAWFERAARAGNPLAAYHLARLLSDARPQPTDDPARAAMWLKAAASQGVAAAQNELGVVFKLGMGVPRDLAQAAQWFEKAAKGGWVAAMTNFARAAQAGEGMPRDTALAAHWFAQAAAKGNARAKRHLGQMLAYGEGVPRDVPRALVLLEEAGRAGQMDGYTDLGAIYERGDLVERDVGKARAYYARAAKDGDPLGQLMLGNTWFMHAPRDLETAARWWRKAANQGYGPAQLQLATAYEAGVGVTRNSASALYWYVRARQSGAEEAAARIEKVLKQRVWWAVGREGATLRRASSPSAPIRAELAPGTRVYPINAPKPGWQEVYVPDLQRLGFLPAQDTQLPAPQRASVSP